MKLLKNPMARSLVICGILLPFAMSAHAWQPNARDRNAAIKAGDFEAHVANLGKWLGQEVPASPQQITKKSVGALLKDPEFMSAIIERRFITRVWGEPTLGDWAKADPGNREFLAWLMSRPALMDVLMLARTPSAGFARLDDSWSIDIKALENWKNALRVR